MAGTGYVQNAGGDGRQSASDIGYVGGRDAAGNHLVFGGHAQRNTHAGTFQFTARVTDGSSIADANAYSVVVGVAGGSRSLTLLWFVRFPRKATLQ